ncbi:MAG: L-serine ammonia-lyase [Actinomycetia bacterium]|nr:L-serine ammonia-lyase [Actinomycetes bacterium]
MESISVFDILKIGVGPSSSHTLGPWTAALRFIDALADADLLDKVTAVHADLYGSLAKTGRGHGTGIAIMMGLRGEDPETCDLDLVRRIGDMILTAGTIDLAGRHQVGFVRERDIVFNDGTSLDLHANAMTLRAEIESGGRFERTYYSVGGGFVVEGQNEPAARSIAALPHPVESGADLKRWTDELGCSISEVVRRNERTWRTDDEIDTELLHIRDTMIECVFRGCRTEGKLPGGLDVTRRATRLHELVLGDASRFDSATEWFEAAKAARPNFDRSITWLSCFALAVNEENAAYGRVVTAPTNGASGVIPAVLLHYLATDDRSDDAAVRFLMVAAEIGSIFKKGATISAAMGGCQAEIGVSSAMAAAALVEGRGGTPDQALMAAEIAMEHHLGLTCDPVGGLVQVPCIERNAMGAIKAVTAAQLALAGVPDQARVSLDDVIDTMWRTAQDMNDRYKETAEGGLAVKIPVRIIEC